MPDDNELIPDANLGENIGDDAPTELPSLDDMTAYLEQGMRESGAVGGEAPAGTAPAPPPAGSTPAPPPADAGQPEIDLLGRLYDLEQAKEETPDGLSPGQRGSGFVHYRTYEGVKKDADNRKKELDNWQALTEYAKQAGFQDGASVVSFLNQLQAQQANAQANPDGYYNPVGQPQTLPPIPQRAPQPEGNPELLEVVRELRDRLDKQEIKSEAEQKAAEIAVVLQRHGLEGDKVAQKYVRMGQAFRPDLTFDQITRQYLMDRQAGLQQQQALKAQAGSLTPDARGGGRPPVPTDLSRALRTSTDAQRQQLVREALAKWGEG